MILELLKDSRITFYMLWQPHNRLIREHWKAFLVAPFLFLDRLSTSDYADFRVRYW